MHIAFVNTLYPPHGAAGAETTLRLLASRLHGRGHRCTVVTLTPSANASIGEVDGIPVHYIPLANVYWPHGPRRPAALRPIFQILDAFNPVMGQRLAGALRLIAPDVLNFHNLQGFSAAAWHVARRLRIPLVQTLHDYYAACPRSAMWRPGRGNCKTLCSECRLFGAPRRALSDVPTIITSVSHRLFERLNAAGAFRQSGRRPSVRIIRGNNAFDSLPNLPATQNDGTVKFGFLGRLDRSKGLENLIDAFARLPPGAAKLAIAGGGRAEYANALQRRAAVRSGIRFLGHVDPASFLPTIDFLVIPSIWEDPFPRVFHEALAYGVPSIVSPLGGIPEVIEPGRTGFLTARADADALHEVLSRLVHQGWNRDHMREASRQAARAYAPDRIVGQYEAALIAAAGNARVPEEAGEAWRPQPAALH